MYALFLETEAAQQIDRYAQDKGVDAEEIKQACYENAVKGGLNSDWFINECLRGDKHKCLTVSGAFYWEGTVEGHKYWSSINDY